MQLWYAPTSPFARKTRIAVAELGLAGQVELIEVNPWTDARLRALNPLAKVPTLVTAQGEVLYESGVICDWLDSLGPRRLFPEEGPARWRALLLQGLADGAATAVGRLFADERRAPGERSEQMLARFRSARDSALQALEQDLPAAGPPTIGEISVAAFLTYLDFRWPERDWRGTYPRLAGWLAELETRPSLVTTAYHLPAG